MSDLLDAENWLVMPYLVHLMVYAGLNDDGLRSWKMACGSRVSEATWEAADYVPSLAAVFSHDLGYCRRCLSVKRLTEALVEIGWDAVVAEREVRFIGDHRPEVARHGRDAIAHSFETRTAE